MTNSNERIRTLIAELGITQAEFCRKTKILKSALSNYLSGNRCPRQDQIMKIAETFNVNPAWIMGYDVQKEWIREPIYVEVENTGLEAELKKMLRLRAYSEGLQQFCRLSHEKQQIVFTIIRTFFLEEQGVEK